MYLCGNDLRAMRHRARLTTVQMAKLAGVKTRKTYENWEKDVGSPSINQFISMATGCQYNAGELVAMALKRNSESYVLDYDNAVRR